MTNEELDVAIEELELRLERLRALYEQYFLGFEKVEPAVARKDVDRRIYVLRREKIRNTGKRFKLQTLIQRYNTFQQYWQRVCREIENGTYRRMLLRAERKFGPNEVLTIAAQRRFGRRAAGAGTGDSSPPAQHSPSDAPEAATLRPPPASSAPAPSPASPSPAQPIPAASGFATEEPGTGTLGRRLAPPPKPVRRPTSDAASPGPSPLPPRPEAPSSPLPPPPGTPPAPRPRTQRPSAFDSLKLDMDFLGDWDPGSLTPKAPGAKPPPPTPAAKPASPTPAAKPTAPAMAPARPAAPPRPAAAPAAPSRGAPPAPEKPAAPNPALKPKSSPRAAPPPRPAPAASTKEPRPASAEGFDARVKELHVKLNELKRQNREGSQVSLEGLAKSLRDTEAKLREKHGSRRIDFEVVLKDGRAVVKPIVR